MVDTELTGVAGILRVVARAARVDAVAVITVLPAVAGIGIAEVIARKARAVLAFAPDKAKLVLSGAEA